MRATHRSFLEGIVAGLPFLVVVGPFALIFGVVATEAGFDLLQTMAMSALVIAGASQFTAVQLMAEDAPLLVILGASLAVNLRMAMYSAAMVPHMGAAPFWQRALAAYFLVDQSFAVSIRRFDNDARLSRPEKMAYFFGAVVPVFPTWYAGSWIGAVAGSALPPEYALDFAVPIAFLALIAPYLRSLPHLAAAVTSVVLMLGLAGLPPGVGLIIAALAAIVTGAAVDVWLERRR